MVIDLMTKIMPPKIFNEHVERMGILDVIRDNVI